MFSLKLSFYLFFLTLSRKSGLIKAKALKEEPSTSFLRRLC
jgi:hypothetical protein